MERQEASRNLRKLNPFLVGRPTVRTIHRHSLLPLFIQLTLWLAGSCEVRTTCAIQMYKEPEIFRVRRLILHVRR